MFSVIKKISITNTNRKYKDMKIKPIKNDGYCNNMCKGEVFDSEKTINKGILELFTKYLINYSLKNDEVQVILGYDKTTRNMYS